MKTKTNNKCGYALITIMGIMAVMTITFAMLMKIGHQGVFTGKLLKERTKATAYAEAGIELAYAILRDNFDQRTDLSVFLIDTDNSSIIGSTVKTTYGEGNYTLKITDLNNDGQYIILNSIGTCGRSSAEVEAMIEDTTFNAGGRAWSKAIAGGGAGKFGGGGFAGTNQTIHLNGDISVNGSVDLVADISSSGEIDGNNLIDGTKIENAPIISTPNLAPNYPSFPDLLKTAILNGEFKTGKTQLKDNYTIPGGIMYVDGDVLIKANIIGTVIATGSITFLSGGVTENGAGIAVATPSGNISYASNGNSTGLFYSKTGNFSQTAGLGSITGQIIVGGDVDKTGGGDLIFTPTVVIETTANPVIAGWQK